MTGRRFGAHVDRLLAALGFPLTSVGRSLATVGFAVATYCLLILGGFPAYSAQMLGAGPQYAAAAVVALTANAYATVGPIGVGLIVAYALLTGVALTTALARVRLVGATGARGLSGLLPGLLASGCASCGAGVLGLLGLVGALAALPFHGNLLRLGGLALLVASLSRVGDPRRCDVPGTDGGE
jgi:hypothetical protein